jgi:hypothetical protein
VTALAGRITDNAEANLLQLVLDKSPFDFGPNPLMKEINNNLYSNFDAHNGCCII